MFRTSARRLVVFMAPVIAWSGTMGAQEMTSEQLQAFRSAKTVRISVKESYRDAPKASAGYDGFAQSLMGCAGLSLVELGQPADLEIDVRATGEARKIRVVVNPIFGARDAYLGVHVTGSITWSASGVGPYTQRFVTSIDPQENLAFIRGLDLLGAQTAYSTPEMAPFRLVLQEWESSVQYAKEEGAAARVAVQRPLTSVMFDAVEKLYGTRFLVAATLTPCHYLINIQASVRLNRSRDPAVVESLAQGLKNPDPRVRVVAAQILGDVENPSAVPALAETLSDPDTQVSIAAASSLGKLKAVEPLAPALKDPRPEIRRFAAYALGKVRDPRAAPALEEVLADADPKMQEAAAEALAEIRAASAPALALKHADSRVRRRAAFWLGFSKDPEAIPVLIEALTDPDNEVQKNVASSLKSLSGYRQDFGLEQAKWRAWWDAQRRSQPQK